MLFRHFIFIKINLNKHKVLTINTLIFKKTSTQKHEYEINFPNKFKY